MNHIQISLRDFWVELDKIYEEHVGDKHIPALADEGTLIMIEQDIRNFVEHPNIKVVGDDWNGPSSPIIKIKTELNNIETKKYINDILLPFIMGTLLDKWKSEIAKSPKMFSYSTGDMGNFPWSMRFRIV